LKWKTASADFSQKDYDIANAIDGDPRTGWAIHPEIGKAHQAVFEFAQPIKKAGALSIQLDFLSQFSQHQLGCFRLSVTDAAKPHDSQRLPADIVAILKIPIG